jgi:hypothetical protein
VMQRFMGNNLTMRKIKMATKLNPGKFDCDSFTVMHKVFRLAKGDRVL